MCLAGSQRTIERGFAMGVSLTKRHEEKCTNRNFKHFIEDI